MKAQALDRPLSFDRLRDGAVYSLRLDPLRQTSLFFDVGLVDGIYVKMPSQKGLDDYRSFIRQARSSASDIRELEHAERFEALDAALLRFPEFRPAGAANREVAHYLVVHRMQYERLRSSGVVNVPEARFALLGSVWPTRRIAPILFQQRVDGTTLWDMFDFSVLEVTRPWWRHLPAISAQLKAILASHLLAHIDWNIQNFVFREADQRLFYVDMKPTTLVAVESNEKNLNGIREYFVE